MSSDLFFGTTGPRDADIMVVGEAWGREEFERQKAFQGEAGDILNKMLAEAGISRDSVFCTNIVPARPPKNELYQWFTPSAEAKKSRATSTNGLFPNARVQEGLRVLYEQVRTVRPKIIIGCGNYPFWAFNSNVDIRNSTNPSGWKVPGGITLWRGSQLETDRGGIGLIPFLPLIHPAGISRQWSQRAITVRDLRLRVPLAFNGKWERPIRTYLAPPTFTETIDYLRYILDLLSRSDLALSMDIETYRRLAIVCLGMSHDGETAISIPFLRPTATGMESYWQFHEEVQIVRLIRQIAHHPNLVLIGQNWLYDAQYLAKWWRVTPRSVFDTMLAQHVMFPGTPKALWYLSSFYCAHHVFWKDEGKEWDVKLDIERELMYNCEDAVRTYQVAQRQLQGLLKLGLESQFDFKMAEWHLAFRMMQRGVPVDKKVRSDMSSKVILAAEERKAFLNRVVPEWCRPVVGKAAKPWYQSPKQQQTLFYEIMALKAVHHRKTGKITADDTALSDIKFRYPHLKRIVSAIAELRSLGVFQNNFLSAELDVDDRMRCSFNPAGTDTFRWSSSENAFGRGTNLQNIPKGNEDD